MESMKIVKVLGERGDYELDILIVDADATMTGMQIRTARRVLALTQVGLANELGLSSNFIAQMERGEKAIDRRTQLSIRYLLQRAKLMWQGQYHLLVPDEKDQLQLRTLAKVNGGWI